MKRIEYLDYLRALAIIGIVVIHSFDPFVIGTNHTGSLFIASLFRFAVPLYVVISGALLLSHPITDSVTFYKKRVAKIGIPLLVWTVIYILYNQLGGKPLTSESLISYALFGQPFYLIWALLGLYLITPFLRRFLESSTKQEVYLATTIALILSIVSSSIEVWLLADKNVLPAFSIIRFVPFIGYYLLGYVLASVKFSFRLAFLLWGLSSLAVFLTTNILFGYYGFTYKSQLLYQYHSPFVVAATVGIFLLMKHINLSRWLDLLVKSISVASFGIYFVHMLIIDQINRPIHTNIEIIILANSVVFIVALAGSYVLTTLYQWGIRR